MPKYTLPTEPTAGRVVLPTEPSPYPTRSVYPPKPSTTPAVPYRDVEDYKNQALDTLTYWAKQAFDTEWARYGKEGWDVPEIPPEPPPSTNKSVSAIKARAEYDAAVAYSKEYAAMQEKVLSGIQNKYEGYLTQFASFVNKHGLTEYTPSVELILRNFAEGKTEREILSYQSQKRDEALAIPTFENRRNTILSNPSLSYQQKQAYITNIAWGLRDKGVSDPQIETLIRESLGGEFAKALVAEQKALGYSGGAAAARVGQLGTEWEAEMAKVPQYQTAFESVAQGSQPWKSWFESQYPSLVSRFKLTLPEVPTTAKTMEKSWADWLAKKTPELKEEFASLPSSYRGERPWAYAPAIKTVRF